MQLDLVEASDEIWTGRRAWSLHRVRHVLPEVSLGFDESLPTASSWPGWRERVGIPVGTPFLLDPLMSYDVDLNSFFYSESMIQSSAPTRVGYARDLKNFLDFLDVGRNGTDWRHASSEDHRNYLIWRREEPRGPRVNPSTWNRELSAVHRFYEWQIASGRLHSSPIPTRTRIVRRGVHSPARVETVAATYAKAVRGTRVSWLPSRSYRTWRDVGLRGYLGSGVPDSSFRGRWSDRNSTFADLMVRTGMRVSEQASLQVSDVPAIRSTSGFHRFMLPESIAKGSSARWIYVPSSVLRNLHAYLNIDRTEVVRGAQLNGTYERMIREGAKVISSGSTTEPLSRKSRAELLRSTPDERRLLLIEGLAGLEPAALWLNESGRPMSVSSWKDIFRRANIRCASQGLEVAAHPHMLRHTFAVLTLEQLQRGHIEMLASLNRAQRGHYTRVFGDPLDWVRRRLGHRSVTTTQIYLHALEELEMETRMSLVSDSWEDPRDSRLIANLSTSASEEL